MPKPVRLPALAKFGLVRSLVTLPFAAACWWIVIAGWRKLRFSPSAVDNRITDFALAGLYLLIAGVGCMLLWSGVRWLIFVLHPERPAVSAEPAGLSVPTGPLGRTTFDWPRMTARYSFELRPDGEAFPFESLMDEDDEPDARLPAIWHPACRELVNYRLGRFLDLDDPTVIARLRPWMDYVRALNPAPPDDEDED